MYRRALTGNTKKVANAIGKGLNEAGFHVSIKEQHEAEDEDFFDWATIIGQGPIGLLMTQVAKLKG